MKLNNILKLRIFLFSLLGLIILFLIYQAVVPFGKITYKGNACGNSFFISKLKPTDRTSGECQNIITGDPVYFNLNTQRTFDSAKVTVNYKTSDQNSIIELGVLADAQKHYLLKPLENKILDNLNWSTLSENGIYLLQKKQKYEDVSKFLDNIKEIPRDKIATYYYNLPNANEIPNYGNYLASSKAFPSDSIPALRGAYQFYTYLERGNLDFIFKFKKLDNDKNEAGSIDVYYKNNLIKQGDISANSPIELTMENQPTGFYKIAVNTSDNIITEKIKSTQRIISFINKVQLAKTPEPGLITMTTDSSEIFIRTVNPDSLQKIKIGNKILNITETYKQFSQITNSAPADIKLAKDGVEIAGDGLFSFSAEALYNPSYKKINKNANLENVDYIITKYAPNNSTDLWKTKTVEFDLKNSFRYEGAYGFIISIPGLLADDEIDDFIELGNIEIKLKGRTLFEKVLSFKF
ncbi:MAG: hypothetical protein WC323_01890 [Patescibacteria group bacterium]|jgi:hypothetical protein